MVRSRKGRAAVLVTLALGASACGSSSSTSSGDDDPADVAGNDQSEEIVDEGDPVDGGTLIMGVEADTPGWNPAVSQWAMSSALMGSAILEPLATLDGDGVAQPWLATKWTPNEDFTVWTIDLRPGVTFHDGTPFDAEAAKANFDLLETAPIAAIALAPLIDETTVVDSDTIDVHLSTRWGSFPSSMLAGQSALQKSPASLASEDLGASQPVGTGPFVFKSWEPDVGMKAEANDEYWREGEPHLDAVEFRVIPDPSSRASALEAGDIHVMVTDVADDATRLEAEFTVLRNWHNEPALLLPNTRPSVSGKPNPMSNLNARKAVAAAINPDEVAELIGEGVSVPTSPFSPESPWGQPADENGYPGYDPEAAKEALAAYTEETGEETLTFTIMGSNDSEAEAVLRLVQEQLAAAGIEADISMMEQSALISATLGAKFEVALGFPYSSPDPDQDTYYWSAATAPGEGGLNINFTGFFNDVTQEALAVGRESDDFATRKQAYTDLVVEQNANATTFWLYETPYSMVAAPAVRGLARVDEAPWANFDPKVWYGGLWLAQD